MPKALPLHHPTAEELHAAHAVYVDIEQCTAAGDEEQFGSTLLKTLDEWNYVIWTKGWIDPPT